LESQSNDIEVKPSNSMVACFLRSCLSLRSAGDCAAFRVFAWSRRLVRWLFIFAALAHLIFGIHFGNGTLAWHGLIAALYALAAINSVVGLLRWSEVALHWSTLVN